VDISVIFYAVVALVSVGGGWLIASYQHAQQKAEQLAEREEIVAELSAAKQQIAQSAHWRDECELLNNELRNLRDINTSLEADLREVTTRLESTQLHAEDKIRQMMNSEQRLSEQFENLANRIFEHSNRVSRSKSSLASSTSITRKWLSGTAGFTLKRIARDMRGTNIYQGQQRHAKIGLRLPYVQHYAQLLPRVESVQQCGVVYHRPTAGVNQNSARLEGADQRIIGKMQRFVRPVFEQRRMESQDCCGDKICARCRS
jgi:chaperonin cofactor prefoldin